MSSLYTRGNAIIPVTGVDFTDKEGYLIKNNAGAPALNDSKTVQAIGVVLEGDDAAGVTSVGMLGALPATIRLKAGGAIAKFAKIVQNDDGTVITDPGAGTARVQVGTALEAAAAGDLFEVAPQTPLILA